MPDFNRPVDSQDPHEVEERERTNDLLDPNAREQRDLLIHGRDPEEPVRVWHPLAPSELQQRRLRRDRGRSESVSGDEAA